MSGVDKVNMMDENPELRWSFIRKVYSIVIFQLLLTIAVVSILVFVPSIAKFLNNYVPYLCIFSLFELLSVVYYHHKNHPLSYFLLPIFNVSFSLLLGLLCVFLSGKIRLEAVTLNTTAVVFILTLYTFWAIKRGHNFEFLGPFLLRAFLILVLIIVIEILIPLEKFSTIISGCFAMITGSLLFINFCGIIVGHIESLIKKISYDEYILASISLYLDVMILFLSLCILYSRAQSLHAPPPTGPYLSSY